MRKMRQGEVDAGRIALALVLDATQFEDGEGNVELVR